MFRPNGDMGQFMGEGLCLDVDRMLGKNQYLGSATVGREAREAVFLLNKYREEK